MFVTWRELNGMHQAVEICARGGGSEAGKTTGGRGVEEHDGGLLGLWETFGDGFIIQIPWEVADSSG